MRWKIVFAVLIVFMLIGAIFTTRVGEQYTGWFTRIVGSFTDILNPSDTSSRIFTVTLTTSKDMLKGYSYKLQNSTFIGSGNYLFIRVDGGSETVKESTNVDMRVGSANGNFELTKEGTVRLNVNSNQIVLNDVERTRDKAYVFETEIQPTDFVLSPIIQDKISFTSVNGNLKIGTKTVVKIELSETSLDISNFAGFLQLNKDNEITLNGFASKIVIDGEEVGISAQ